MDYIRGASRNQVVLFPETVEDYITEDNPVRFIDAFVASLDLAALGFTHATPAETINQRGRRITRWVDEKFLEDMACRVRARPELMRRRQQLSEPPFGTIKRAMGQGYFLMRGLNKVGAETSLTVLSYNLKRVINLIGVPKMIEAVT